MVLAPWLTKIYKAALLALLLSDCSHALTGGQVERSMTKITRRAAIGLLAAGGALLGVGAVGGFLLRDALKSFFGEGMMGSAS